MTRKSKMGAPKGSGLKYTTEHARAICEALASGKTLSEHCRDAGICRETVYAWRDAFPDFAQQLARARDIGEETIAESCLQIADDATNDWMERFNKDGEADGAVLNAEHVQRSKLRIETRLKLLKIWNPKKYGDRITHAGDPDAPVALQLNGSDVHG